MLIKKLNQFLLTGAFIMYSLLSNVAIANSIPDCSNATASPNNLWPPNHKFSNINIEGVTDADGDDISIAIRCIKQDEPLNSTGDGNFIYDGSGIDNATASVRKERKGNGNGRFYHIFYVATDTYGASCAGDVTVSVPKSKNKTPIDEGPLYDSVPNNNENCGIEITNNAPVVQDQSLEVDEGSSLPVTLQGNDPDGDTLTYSVVSAPSNGTLSGDAPNLVYTPTVGFSGSDSFTFKANDGQVDSNIATVSIDVIHVNTAPFVQSQNLQTDEDTPISVVLLGNDLDGDVLTYSIVSQVSSGSLMGTPDNLMYTPNADFNGIDTFSFQASDGELLSNIATVKITVRSVNDLPTVSANGNQTIIEGESVSLSATANDPDGSIINQEWTHSGLYVGNQLTTTITNLTVGQHEFVITVTDSDGATATDSVLVTVEENPNVAPTANSQSVSVTEDQTKAITLTAQDSDGDVLEYQIVRQPSKGTLSGEAPNLTYTPNANYSGNDSFVFTVTDGLLVSAQALVSIDVIPVNEAPTVNAGDDQTITVSRVVSLLAEASDPDDDIETYQWTNQSNDVVGTTEGITLNNLAVGEHVFTITVTDSGGLSATDSVTVFVQEDQIILGSLTGKVLDQKGVVVVNAKVALATGEETVSDENGDYTFENVQPTDRSTVTASRNNFLQNSEIIIIESGKETIQNIVLSRPQTIMTVTPSEGATITAEGMTLEIPPATSFVNESGESFEGEVTINTSYFSITTDEGINEFPGDTLAITDEGEVGSLISYGFVKLEATDGSGNEIQLAEGQELDISIPADDNLDKPATIPFWYFDEEQGIWVEDGVATYDPETNTYKTRIDRMLNYNLDAYVGAVSDVEVCVVDEQGNPAEGYVLLEPANKEWRYLSQTSEDGLVKISRFIGESNFNLYAASLDGHLGEFANNPLYIDAGENKPEDCIVVSATNKSEGFAVSGTVIDEAGNAKPDIDVGFFGEPKGQTFGNPGLTELASTRSDANGNLSFSFDGTDPVAIEIALLGNKEVTLIATEGSAKGQKKLTANKGIASIDAGDITLFPNKPPVANAGLDQIVIDGTYIFLDGEDSYDPDGTIQSYEWRKGSDILAGSRNLTINSLEVGEHVLVLTVTDQFGLKASDDVKITILEKNTEIYANAGLDKTVYPNETAFLDGRNSISVNSGKRYEWSENGVVLGTNQYLSYKSDEIGTHTITLTVTNTDGLSDTDEVVVTVKDREAFVYANAGLDKTVYPNETAFLDGRNSISVNSGKRYEWSENGVVLGTNQYLSYKSDEIGTHTITLTVINTDGLSDTDEVVVTVKARETFVYADAGLDKTVYLNATAFLDARNSISLNSGRTYEWSENGNVLGTGQYLSYTGAEVGTHKITLKVTNSDGLEDTDTVVVTVVDRETFVYAKAGLDRTVYADSIVYLDARYSISLNSGRSYEWSQDDRILGTSYTYPFSSSEIGAHTFTLKVTNSDGLSDTDEVTVYVVNRNEQPTTGWLDVGLDRHIYLGDSVFLNRSIGFFTPIATEWKEGGTVLSTASAFHYTPSGIGPHVITHTVTDQNGISITDEVTIFVTEREKGVKAVAGLDQATTLGKGVTLNGYSSYSLSSNLTYEWSEDGTVLSASGVLAYPADQLGLRTITLKVTDGDGLVDTDTVTVLVTEREKGIKAEAGLDKATTLGVAVNLIAYESYSLSSNLSYEWSEGGTVLGTSSVLRYPADQVGLLTITLKVTDGDGLVDTDTVTVLVTEREKGIKAEAGLDKATTLGVAVNLIAYESYSLSSNLSYEWSEGGTVLGTSSILSYPADQVGLHTITLKVTDGDGLTDTDEVTVLVTDPERGIHANAGLDRNIYQGENTVVTSSGSYSLVGTINKYEWIENGEVISTAASFNYVSNVLGDHVITLNLTDTEGLTATDEVVIAVKSNDAIDSNRPVITLNGPQDITLTQGDTYFELGATAYDDEDGVLTDSIVRTGNIFTTFLIRNHTIYYAVKDRAGNSASVSRIVRIVAPPSDTTPPEITIVGDNPVTQIVGIPYNDRGATVFDNVEGRIGYSFTTDIKTAVPGNYQYVYTATDSAGNSSQAVRTIRITDENGNIDTIPPVITLLGNTTTSIPQDTVYIDAGATATDDTDGDITANMSINSTVNTSVVGSYQVTYSVADAAGNPATQSRTVIVTEPQTGPDTTAPVITLNGDNPLSLIVGSTFTDPGATVIDAKDGSLPYSTSGDVNSNVIGTYEFTYSATDAAGNQASEVRTVNVITDPDNPDTLPAYLEPSLNWLATQQQTDGAYTNDSKISLPQQSTAEALSAYTDTGEQSDPGIPAAVTYLENQTNEKVEFLARKIISTVDAGNDATSLITILISMQNIDGGFGDQFNYHSRVTDTAFALLALGKAQYANYSIIGRAVNYLSTQQSSEGGFSHSSTNTDSVYETSLASLAIKQYQYVFNVASILEASTSYLWANQVSGGGWNTHWESAYALLAITPTVDTLSAYQDAVDRLKNGQLSNGSWNNEVLTTALCIRALYKAENLNVQ